MVNNIWDRVTPIPPKTKKIMKTILITDAIKDTPLGNLKQLLEWLIDQSIYRGYLSEINQLTDSSQKIFFDEQSKIISFKVNLLNPPSNLEAEVEHRDFLFYSILKLLTQALEANNIPIYMDNIQSQENHHLILHTSREYLTIHLNGATITFTYYYTDEGTLQTQK